MAELITFFIILIAGLVFSDIFKRLNLPYVTALIVAGVVIGPFGFDMVQINPTLEFLGSIGIVFLMFIAGSEIKTEVFKEIKKNALILSAFNGLIPFAIGLCIGYYFTSNYMSSLILGTIFMSSSVGVIIPALEAKNIIHTSVGKSIIASTVIEDIFSLLLLSFILQSVQPISLIPWYLYLPILFGTIWLLKTIIPKLYNVFQKGKRGKDFFEGKLRFVFITLIAVVLLFEVLGMHAIIAGFVTGMILTDSLKGALHEKIRTMSYGLFIPIFFLIIGAQMDISIFYVKSSLVLISVIIFGLIVSKIFSGFFGGLVNKFSKKASILIGVSTIPQLSTSLAAAFAAFEFGLLNNDIISGLILLSIITTLLAPFLINMGYRICNSKDLEKND